MKIVGIIPARFNSTRFPGKVLALLGNRPLCWHVYNAAVKSGVFDAVYIATDHGAVQAACDEYDIPCLMTGTGHRNPTSRTWEASGQVNADFYVMMGADEPMVAPGDIRKVVHRAVEAMSSPSGGAASDRPFVVNAMADISSAPEVFDSSNIKIVCNQDGRCLYASRSPVPYPKGSLDYRYKKFVSIGVYTKEALDFFASSPACRLEKIEEFDLLRFIEQDKTVIFVDIPGPALSVDTPKDLEWIRTQFENRHNEN